MPRGLSPAGATRQTAASTWSGLTEDGEAAFHRLRSVAIAFDQRLRRGITDDDVANLAELLGRLERNVTSNHDPPG
jgi:MarR family transcriptional regulator for hemolysin